jgi:hypothetical protein
LPNNKYELKGMLTSSVASPIYGMINIFEYFNNVQFKANQQAQKATHIVGYNDDKTFITGPNTNNIRIVITGSGVGTFTFSNISLKLKM